MKGKAYCIGVGPGDPELMTLKAVRLIKESDIIAVPGRRPEDSVAYRIALKAVPELKDKKVIALPSPMKMDMGAVREAHRQSADTIKKHLDKGLDVVFMTIGDPTVYSTFMYIKDYLEADGYETIMINGVTSFCAAAARFNIPLARWDEAVHILPAVHGIDDISDLDGNLILMKSASRFAEIRDSLKEKGFEAVMIENCGMDNEKVFDGLDDMPDETGYFSIIFAKKLKK